MNASKLIRYLVEMNLDFSDIYKENLEEVRKPDLDDEIANRLDCLAIVSRFISNHVFKAKKEYEGFFNLINETKAFHLDVFQVAIDNTMSHEQKLIEILEDEDWSWLGELAESVMPRLYLYNDFDGTKKYATPVYEMNKYDKRDFDSLRDYLDNAKSSIEDLYNGDSSKGKVVKKGYYNEFLNIYDDLSESYEQCLSLISNLESKMDDLLSHQSNYFHKVHSLSIGFIEDLKKFRPSNHGWIDFAVSESLKLVEKRHNKLLKSDS